MAAVEAIEQPASVDHHPRIGLMGATALVVGGMIGSGVYLVPATLGAMGSISLLGWVAASCAALALAGVFAFLAAAAPAATGLAAYVEEGLGKFPAAVCAFIYWVECWVGNVALGLAVAGALGFLAPALAAPGPRLAVTLALIWLTVGACAVGPKLVSRIEGLTLVLGLAPVIFAAAFGWFWFHPAVFLASWNPGHLAAPQAVWRSALVVFWAFLGVECAAATAGVVRDPARNVPRASLLGVLAAAGLYIAACAVLMGILPAPQLAASSAPFADAARAALGVAGGTVIGLCVLLRVTGCFAVWTLLPAETSRTAADAGVFPAVLRTRPGERASRVNLLLVGVLMTATALASFSPQLTRQFTLLADITVILALGAYILAAASLLRLAARFASPLARWGACAVAVIAMACAVTLMTAGNKIELLWSLVPVGLGAALYLARPRRRT
ncbi:MAG: amino acid permease [Phenylobacterium sp.]|nr:MAG: amino acid permease [Phenylobacterium sp.]